MSWTRAKKFEVGNNFADKFPRGRGLGEP